MLTPHHALRDLLGMLDVASLGRLALSCAAFGAPCRGVSWYGQQPDLSYGEAAIRSRCGDAAYLRALRPGRSAGPRLLSVHGRRRYTNALHAQRLLRGAASCDTAAQWQVMRTAMAGRGCTVNAVDHRGRTAAYLAVARERYDALRWLVRPPTDLLAVNALPRSFRRWRMASLWHWWPSTIMGSRLYQKIEERKSRGYVSTTCPSLNASTGSAQPRLPCCRHRGRSPDA